MCQAMYVDLLSKKKNFPSYILIAWVDGWQFGIATFSCLLTWNIRSFCTPNNSIWYNVILSISNRLNSLMAILETYCDFAQKTTQCSYYINIVDGSWLVGTPIKYWQLWLSKEMTPVWMGWTCMGRAQRRCIKIYFTNK